MSKEAKRPRTAPTVKQLQKELERVRYQQKLFRALRGTLVLLLVIAAAAAVTAAALPVFSVQSDCMAPALAKGDVVVGLRGDVFSQGDLAVFQFDGKTIIRRVIAVEGDVVDVRPDGTVVVNDQLLSETYAVYDAAGEIDIELPCTVPEDGYFVLGDQRDASVDSRSTAMGCISKEQMTGRIILRIWPFARMGLLDGGEEE